MIEEIWPRASIARVVVENYRSIRRCEISLGPLTVLVGPNAAGKSNFMDSIHFVSDCLKTSVTEAVRVRGGFHQIIHHQEDADEDRSILISLTIRRPEEGNSPAAEAQYTITIGLDHRGKVAVRREQFFGSGGWEDEGFTRSRIFHDQGLYLPVYQHNSAESGGGTAPGDVMAFLQAAAFYDLDTQTLRAVDDSDPSTRPDVLGPRGEHLGHIIGLMTELDREAKVTLDTYVSAMVPTALGLDQRAELDGTVSAVEGRFGVEEVPDEITTVQRWALSEGTLRLGGVLTALLQPAVVAGTLPFVGIEEPEKALHPPKLGILYEILNAASHATQVMVTTQSPDLFDNKAAKPKHILVVENIDGATVIGPINETGMSLYKDKIFNLTDLLRYGSMHPELPGESSEGEE